MSLEFTLVRRAIRLAVIDGPDTDDNPDILQAQGSVLFEPVIKKGDSIQVQTRDGSETYALAPIECPINDGIISHRGQDGVKLPAGGEAANPSLIRWKATFSRMQAGGQSFTLAPVIFDAVPGGEIDLTMVAPVAGAPEGVVRGPRGTSLEAIVVDGSELVFTAVDDAGSFEIARIPLDDMVRAEADAAADGVRDALAVDVAASQSARDAAEGHASRAATSESNAAASESAAKQSETNAGDYAAVATTAATEAVDAMSSVSDIIGANYATHSYVDTLVDSSRYAQSTALEAGTDLDTIWRYTDSKVYRLVAGRAYTNLPQGNSLTTNGTLIVSSTGTAGMQILTQNSSGNVYWRPMHNSTVVPRTWWPWRRLDPGQLESTLDLTFQRRAQLGEGVDLNTLRGNTENGIRILGSHGNYPNRPTDGWTDGVAGAIVVFSTGLGDTWHRVWQRHSGHVWERRESASGNFTPWERVRNSGDSGGSAPATALALPQTTFEAVGMLTTYEEGEAYLDLLNARQPIIDVRQFGQSNQGRPIRGIVIGDDTKPALFIMCAQHGDEISGREAAFVWARQISEMRPDFLEQICVVIVPTVNADKINIRRLTATGTDLNGGWQSRVTNEVQAVYAGIESFDTRAVIDAHEGGSWTQVQFCGGTAPEIDPAVRAANDDFYDAVWSAVENGGGAHPPAHWNGSDKLTNSRNAIPYQLGIPCLLVEMPGQLARAGWNGPGPDPRIYQPNLKNRVESYQLIFKGAAEYLAGTIPTGEA